MIDADGQNQRLLVRNAGEPAYSPDGSKIAYVAYVGDPQTPGGDITIANADGTNEHKITDTHRDSHPAWSPDGTRLAFDRLENGRDTIVVENADGSNQRTVVSSRSYLALDPAWRTATTLPSVQRPPCRP